MNRTRTAVLGTLAAAVAGLAAFLVVDPDGNSSSSLPQAGVTQVDSTVSPQKDLISLPTCILCYL